MGFTRYIGTLQLKYLIMFRMGQLHMKLSANRNAAAGDLELLNSKLQSNITISQTMKNEIYIRLPQVLRRILKEGNHICFYEINEPKKVPEEMLPLVLEGHIFIIDGKIYMVFEDGREYLEFKMKLN